MDGKNGRPMRTMPSTIEHPFNPKLSITLPTLTGDKWLAAVCALVGRELTEGEQSRVKRCLTHNWSVRATAEDILGRDLTYEEVEARRHW